MLQTNRESSPIEIIDVEELAKRLGVRPSWVRDHIRKTATDPIPKVKLGRHVRFAWGSPSMAAWLERRGLK